MVASVVRRIKRTPSSVIPDGDIAKGRPRGSGLDAALRASRLGRTLRAFKLDATLIRFGLSL